MRYEKRPFNSLVQMPDTARLCGYKAVRPHHTEAEYRDHDGFVGTEREYVEAGRAYIYLPIDSHCRLVLA